MKRIGYRIIDNTEIKMAAILVVLICLVIGIFYFSPVEKYDNHQLEEFALDGSPTLDSKLDYSVLTVSAEYRVGLNRLLIVEDNKIKIDLTNLEDNNIWMRAEIYDEKDKLIARTGVLKQNQYIDYIKPIKSFKKGKVTIKIIAYTPEIFNSMGSITLNTEIM